MADSIKVVLTSEENTGNKGSSSSQDQRDAVDKARDQANQAQVETNEEIVDAEIVDKFGQAADDLGEIANLLDKNFPGEGLPAGAPATDITGDTEGVTDEHIQAIIDAVTEAFGQQDRDNAMILHEWSLLNNREYAAKWKERQEQQKPTPSDDDVVDAEIAPDPYEKYRRPQEAPTEETSQQAMKRRAEEWLGILEKGGLINGKAKGIGIDLAEQFGEWLTNSNLGKALSGVGSRAGGALSGLGRLMGFRGAAAGAAGTAGAAGAGGAAAGAAGVASMIPPVLAVTAVLVGLVVAGRALIGAYKRQADELEEYSNKIAGARAAVRAEELLSRIERAQRLGSRLAEFETARGGVNDALYDLMTEIYDTLAQGTEILSPLFTLTEAQLRVLEIILNAIQAASETFQGDLEGAQKELNEGVEAGKKFDAAMRRLTLQLANLLPGVNLDDPNAIRNPGVEAILGGDPFGGNNGNNGNGNGNGNPLPPFGPGGPPGGF